MALTEINRPDSVKSEFGTGNDLEIYHDGSHSWVKNTTGYLRLAAGGNGVTICNADNSETIAAFLKDGAVDLYHNNVLKFATSSSGISVTGDVAATGHVDLEDDKYIKLGTGDDFQLGHASGVNYINLHADLLIRNDTETMMDFNRNAGIELYHDGSKAFETAAHGSTIFSLNNGSSPLLIKNTNGVTIAHFYESSSGDGHHGMLYLNTNAGTNNVKLSTNGASHVLGDFRIGTTSAMHSELTTIYKDGNECLAVHKAGSGTQKAMFIRHGRGLSGYSGVAILFERADGTDVGNIEIGASSTGYNTSSDYRLKENQVTIANASTKVKQLKPYEFNFKDDPDYKYLGFFAHEIQEVIPTGVVSGTKDAVQEDGSIKAQSVDYGRLTPILTAALQEALAEIDTLKTKVAALEAA